MGVAGSGKTTVGEGLAAGLGVPFLDADSLHPPANRAKMEAGVPLDDTDRLPWLGAVREAMDAQQDIVVACSALRRSYRDLLRAGGGVRFVYLPVSTAEAERRLLARHGHFMHANMAASQFAALEEPGADEPDVTTLPEGEGPAALVVAAERALTRTAS